MKRKPLKLSVDDQVKVIDRTWNYKLWFNGMKRFIAIRLK